MKQRISKDKIHDTIITYFKILTLLEKHLSIQYDLHISNYMFTIIKTRMGIAASTKKNTKNKKTDR